MSAYPLNNTNYNWERRPKKCKCDGGGGGGDSEPFDAKKFGDDLMKYVFAGNLPSSTVFPDMYCMVGRNDTFLGPPESDVEFAAIFSGAIQDKEILPLYSSIPDNDKTILCYDGKLVPHTVEGTQTEQEEVDGTTYYLFFPTIG